MRSATLQLPHISGSSSPFSSLPPSWTWNVPSQFRKENDWLAFPQRCLHFHFSALVYWPKRWRHFPSTTHQLLTATISPWSLAYSCESALPCSWSFRDVLLKSKTLNPSFSLSQHSNRAGGQGQHLCLPSSETWGFITFPLVQECCSPMALCAASRFYLPASQVFI